MTLENTSRPANIISSNIISLFTIITIDPFYRRELVRWVGVGLAEVYLTL